MILLLFFLFLIIYITHLPATSSSLVSSHISNLSLTCTSIRPTSVSHSSPPFLSVKLFNFSSTFPPLPPVSFTTHSSHLYIPHSTLSPFPFHPSFSNPSTAIPSSTAYTHPLLIFHASSHPAASSLFFARSLLLLLPRHSLPDSSSHPFPSLLLPLPSARPIRRPYRVSVTKFVYRTAKITARFSATVLSFASPPFFPLVPPTSSRGANWTMKFLRGVLTVRPGAGVAQPGSKRDGLIVNLDRSPVAIDAEGTIGNWMASVGGSRPTAHG